MFQSRNRESFDFYSELTEKQWTLVSASFNLVIENLLISTPFLRFSVLLRAGQSFNLVIENLLISTYELDLRAATDDGFQSRNRESFDFYFVEAVIEVGAQFEFQSRNRESFDFYGAWRAQEHGIYSKFQSRNRESFDFYSSLHCGNCRSR